MLLQLKDSGELLKILDVQELIDPNIDSIHARDQEGQEEQSPEFYKKKTSFFLQVKIYRAVGWMQIIEMQKLLNLVD